MPIDIRIDDSEINGFNNQAQTVLKTYIESFSNDLITEANRIESGINTTSSTPEITSSMVNDANIFMRRGLIQPKKNVWVKVLKIGSSVLSLAVGIMYNPTKLQDSFYMACFIVLLVVTILVVTISTMKE